jgi:hypothetical protein
MYIAAMLAMQSPCERRDEERVRVTPPSPTASFHGRNIVVRELSESGFEADSIHDFPVGSLVRIRLPGAGAALARKALRVVRQSRGPCAAGDDARGANIGCASRLNRAAAHVIDMAVS